MRAVFLLVAVLAFAAVLAGAEDLQKRAPPSEECKAANKQLQIYRNDLRKEERNCTNGEVDQDLLDEVSDYVDSLPELCTENNGQRKKFQRLRNEVSYLLAFLEDCGNGETA